MTITQRFIAGAMALGVAGNAIAGPFHLHPDLDAAATMSLDDVQLVLEGGPSPLVLKYNEDGSIVMRVGTVGGGSCVLSKTFDLEAQSGAPSSPDLYSVQIAEPSRCWTRSFSQLDTQMVLNALQRQRMTSDVERRGWEEKRTAQKAAEDAEFARVAATFRAANPKPVISEEVRRYRVIAEAEVRAKRFDAAVKAYTAGLKIAPWWPEGHFNAAVILGELGLHAEAAAQMTKYLMLVPDAPDARQAQDKIYEWMSGN